MCYCTEIWCLAHTCEDADIVEAISHAIDNDYHIINMSLGGPAVGQAVQDAVTAAFDAGLILVAGAGNNYQLNPPNHFYPADCEGVISVAATDHYDNIASFSNFGLGVDIAAPGTSILSTYPSAGCSGIADCYNWMDGTSMATPVVSGAAALVLDNIGGDPIVRSPSLRDDVIDAILNNADHTGALGQNMLAWTQNGRLNLYRALTGGGPVCGDGTCNAGEDPCNCSADCGTPPLTEVGYCTDGVNNDCDTLTDCDDTDCTSDLACTCGDATCDPGENPCNCLADCGELPEATCDDGVDNDCNGDIDCADANCASDPACLGCSTCFKGVCDGKCNPKKDGPGCPDCS